MKVLIAGSSWHHPMYEAAWKIALEKLGNNVVEFSTLPSRRNIFSRIEQKYSLNGIYSREIQNRLIEAVLIEKPDVVLVWLGTGVFPETIRKLKKYSKSVIVNYIHDDPFSHRLNAVSPRFHWLFYRQFIKSLPYYDHVFFSKKINVEEARSFGCHNASVLMQYYLPDFHCPQLALEVSEDFVCDVAFAGHFEPDGRDRCINHIAELGYRINIYGDSTWKKSSLDLLNPNLKLLPRANGSDYPRAISNAKISLCFMSKMNRDDYTTRCFEIPAIGSLLLSERTAPLMALYEENVEAVFFSNEEELLKKISTLMANTGLITDIAIKGNKKVISSKQSVDDRVSSFIGAIGEVEALRLKETILK